MVLLVTKKMEGKLSSFCIICFEQFTPQRISSQYGNLNQKTFVKFCKDLTSSQLNSKSVENCRKRLNQDGKSAQKLSKFDHDRFIDSLKLFENLAPCSTCQGIISVAVKSKEMVTETEIRVRHLQHQILKELRQLEKQVEEYYLELRILENSVTNSPDVSCLEEHLGGNRNRARRNATKNLRCDITSFRNQIVNVLEDLRCSREFDKAFKKSNVSNVSSAHVRKNSSEAVMKLNDVLYVDQPSAPDPDALTSLETSIDESAIKEEIPEEELENLNNSTLNNSCSLDMPESFEESDGDGGSDYAPKDEEDNDSDRPPFVKTSHEDHNIYLKKDMNGVEFSMNDFSRFKQRMIARVLFKLEQREKELENSNSDYLLHDPRKNFLFKYDHHKGSLFAGDIEVTINETEESVKCTKCGHQEGIDTTNMRRRCEYKPEQKMHIHVMTQHLYKEAFKCPVCFSIFRKYKIYNQHVQGHRNKFACDICGKPLFSMNALRGHKWLHMNEEEKKEAERKGMVNLKKRRRERMIRGEFPCSTCGKICLTLVTLKQHEKCHNKDRERVVCPQCGKSIVKGSFIVHQRNVCPTEEMLLQGRPTCQQCFKSFSSKANLTTHVRRIHTKADEKPFPCKFCSRAFKSKDERMVHERRHSAKRNFTCPEGCGATFIDSRSCKRHAQVCDGMGTRVRRRKGITKTHLVRVDAEEGT